MNRIYWDRDKVSMLTDQIESAEHKHCAMQLFLSLDGELDLCVSGIWMKCRCVVVNSNIRHSFSTDSRLHFSVIIEPAAGMARQLETRMHGRDYCMFDNDGLTEIQGLAAGLAHGTEKETDRYRYFMDRLCRSIGLTGEAKEYEVRLREVIQEIREFEGGVPSISFLAERVSLSPSRLSHLFREQAGMSLKHYIQYQQMKKAFLAMFHGKNITEAAMLAGFDTPSHFAAVTKRMMGMPASISLKNSVFLKVY